MEERGQGVRAAVVEIDINSPVVVEEEIFKGIDALNWVRVGGICEKKPGVVRAQKIQ